MPINTIPGQLPTFVTLATGENRVSEPWHDWFRKLARILAPGVTVTVPLAKITGGGTDGSLTIVDGVVTSVTQPT